METDHVVDIGITGWGIQHPEKCKPNMLDCDVHNRFAKWMDQLNGPPVAVGRYWLSDGLTFAPHDDGGRMMKGKIGWQVLGALVARGEPAKPKELAEITGLTPHQVRGALMRLYHDWWYVERSEWTRWIPTWTGLVALDIHNRRERQR